VVLVGGRAVRPFGAKRVPERPDILQICRPGAEMLSDMQGGRRCWKGELARFCAGLKASIGDATLQQSPGKLSSAWPAPQRCGSDRAFEAPMGATPWMKDA
jgi:hypothetical protein